MWQDAPELLLLGSEMHFSWKAAGVTQDCSPTTSMPRTARISSQAMLLGAHSDQPLRITASSAPGYHRHPTQNTTQRQVAEQTV